VVDGVSALSVHIFGAAHVAWSVAQFEANRFGYAVLGTALPFALLFGNQRVAPLAVFSVVLGRTGFAVRPPTIGATTVAVEFL
jgi:hypothetical protein